MTGIAQHNIDISVIIPAYNAAETVERCLLSLARQTLPQDQIEVIFVDDASTDETAALAKQYGSRIANFVYVRHDINKRQGEARNLGIELARGRCITFLDSDDFLRLDALETAFYHMGDADCLVFQHRFCRFDGNYAGYSSDRSVGSDLKLSALSGEVGWWPFGLLIRSDIVKSNRIRFATGAVYFEDIDFVIAVFSHIESAKVIGDVLYYYVQTAASTVNSITDEKLGHAVEAMARGRARLIENGADDVYRDALEAAAERWFVSQGRRIAAQVEGTERDKLFFNFGMHIGTAFGGPADLDFPRRWAPPTLRPAPGGYQPWSGEFDDRLSGKVVFYCEADYHVRTAAAVCRRLAAQGIPSLIVDASGSRNFTANRSLKPSERGNFADVDILQVDVARARPFSTTAAAFVFQNDLTYTKELIFENFGYGMPTIGLYEGINDDLNADRPAPRRPYRSVDYLLLPGEFQRRFYADRETEIVGLSSVRTLLTTPFVPGRAKRAIINVNFTYGVLEAARDEFIRTATEACDQVGLPYVISQHPADKADLKRYPVSRERIYDLLAGGGVLISRFSTTLLEALALGRAAVYHNPINEQVEKFQEPLGAYRVTASKSELVAALRAELETGLDVDRRERAMRFLDQHCNVSSPTSPEDAAAAAIAKVLARGRVAPLFKMSSPEPGTSPSPPVRPRPSLRNRAERAASMIKARSPASHALLLLAFRFVRKIDRRWLGLGALMSVAAIAAAVAVLSPYGPVAWSVAGLALAGAAVLFGMQLGRQARERRDWLQQERVARSIATAAQRSALRTIVSGLEQQLAGVAETIDRQNPDQNKVLGDLAAEISALRARIERLDVPGDAGD